MLPFLSVNCCISTSSLIWISFELDSFVVFQLGLSHQLWARRCYRSCLLMVVFQLGLPSALSSKVLPFLSVNCCLSTWPLSSALTLSSTVLHFVSVNCCLSTSSLIWISFELDSFVVFQLGLSSTLSSTLLPFLYVNGCLSTWPLTSFQLDTATH